MTQKESKEGSSSSSSSTSSSPSSSSSSPSSSTSTTTSASHEQIMAALTYALSSVGIMFVNKLVLTSYGFPSSNFLALTQYLCTMMVCVTLKGLGKVSYPTASARTFGEIMPLPLLFLCNALSGLGGTKKVNLPMFTVLRRFSILFTMMLEQWVLRQPASAKVKFSIFLMILGSFIAAARDLTPDYVGYFYILINDVFTALNGVVTKQKAETKRLGEWGVLFYNSLYSLPFLLVLTVVVDFRGFQQALAFPLWGSSVAFVVAFSLASMMGCLLQYSTVHCTKVNSALTTTVIGCLKNVLTTYIGMLMVDYRFASLNFIGLNISILGSLYYSYAKYKELRRPKRTNPSSVTTPMTTLLPLTTSPPPSEENSPGFVLGLHGVGPGSVSALHPLPPLPPPPPLPPTAALPYFTTLPVASPGGEPMVGYYPHHHHHHSSSSSSTPSASHYYYSSTAGTRSEGTSVLGNNTSSVGDSGGHSRYGGYGGGHSTTTTTSATGSGSNSSSRGRVIPTFYELLPSS